MTTYFYLTWMRISECIRKILQSIIFYTRFYMNYFTALNFLVGVQVFLFIFLFPFLLWLPLLLLSFIFFIFLLLFLCVLLLCMWFFQSIVSSFLYVFISSILLFQLICYIYSNDATNTIAKETGLNGMNSRYDIYINAIS